MRRLNPVPRERAGSPALLPAAAALAALIAWGGPSPVLAATALVGGTVHTVSGETLQNAVVLVEGTTIAAVGTDVAVPEDAERVDVTGLHVYPGMIAANTVLGLVEINSVDGTVDVAEHGSINPNARAMVAINSDSEIIPVSRAGGVLTALSATTGGVLSGTSVLWNLDGWTWEEMAIVEPLALHVRWPSVGKSGWWDRRSEEEIKKDSEKKLKELTEAFANARAYHKARQAMAGGGAHHDTDVRWEAMIPALEGTMPVFVHADQKAQIESALDFAREQELRIVIVGGGDAPYVADRLAAEGVPVIVQDVLEQPRRSWEPYDAAYTVAAKLHEAGVDFCITTGGSGFSAANLRNLPYHAGMAAAFGLPKDEALKAVTLHPARILGVGDRLGSIEAGKDANLLVTDGDLLELRTNVLHAWIAGQPVDLASRHTRLYERYRSRPRPDDSETRLEPSPAAGR